MLLDRKLISENTAREGLRSFRLFRRMKNVTQEAKDAEKNQILLPPVDLTQNGNGNGTKPKVGGQVGNN